MSADLESSSVPHREAIIEDVVCAHGVEKVVLTLRSMRKLHAPGRSGGLLRLPSSTDPLPRIDERLAPPETRIEYIDGIEYFAAPADPPHATKHSDLDALMRIHTKKGFTCAVDMLTRTGHPSDMAPDVSIYPSSPDPKTGGRRLEELAFEVTSKQRIRVPTEKARHLIARGVRRVFCLLVNEGRVMEWHRETDSWKPLHPDAVIDDAVLVRPVAVRELLDAALVDDAVARALLAKDNPVLRGALDARREEGREAGALEATRAALELVLLSQKAVLSAPVRRAILECQDTAQLRRWLLQVAAGKRVALARRSSRTRAKRR